MTPFRLVGMGKTAGNSKNHRRPSGGLRVIFEKELADHFSSIRFGILFLLIVVTGLASFYVAAVTIRSTVESAGEDNTFVFLRLFTTYGSLPPFTSFLSFLGPLVGLSLGFDAINGERNRGTLSRLLAQPIYRDDVINGKFLAGVTVLAIISAALCALVGGAGILLTGIPPTGEEVVRLAIYVGLNVVYIAFWLSLAILFSLIFRQAATSALASTAAWLFFSVFVPLLAGLVADTVFPVSDQSSGIEAFRNIRLEQGLSRISPTVLYSEAATTILSPGVRTLGPIFIQQAIGAVAGPLPLGQSLLIVWPQLTALVAATLVMFGLAYTLFLRQEIRA